MPTICKPPSQTTQYHTMEVTHTADFAGEEGWLGKRAATSANKPQPTLTNSKERCENMQVRRKLPQFVKLATTVAVLVNAIVGLSCKRYSRSNDDRCYLI